MRTPPVPDEAVSGLRGHDAGHWGVLLAALVAVVMSLAVSAAFVVSRIDDGTTAARRGGLTVAATPTAASFAAATPASFAASYAASFAGAGR